MTPASAAALFGAMAVLAAVPSVSVLAVTARSAAGGFRHGVFTTAGIVLADVAFILVAIFGLAFLAEAMGDRFVLVKYLGGAYLLWLGIALLRSGRTTEQRGKAPASSAWSSFMTGLLITLGDQKAILFYLGFFPAFLDLAAMNWRDAVIVVAIAVVAVGGVKLGYAWAADRAGALLGSRAGRAMNALAGGVLVIVAILLVLSV